MNVRTRLACGFALIVLALVLVAILSHFTVQGMLREGDITNEDMAMATELTQREVDHLLWVAKVRDFIADEQVSQLAVETDHHKCGFGKWYYGESARQLGERFPALAPLLQRLEEPHRRLHQSAIAIRQGEKSGAAVIYSEQTAPALAEVQPLLRQVRDELKKEVEQRRVDSSRSSQNRSRMIDFSIIGALILTVVLGIITSRGIVRVVGRFYRGMTDISRQVASSSRVVAAGGQELAEGASEQAASLEETSASVEEIASMTKQNTDNAIQADKLMRDASSVVQRAGASMAELTAAMHTITRSSEETSKIVKTIDEIAFQTNLLALNAAVEAARAGEAGAGFAVVADEVRNLAMRAAEAAKNTAGLIDDTVERVREGAQLVARTSDAFTEVMESTGKASGLVGEIAAASNEQAHGIGQLNTAMSEMDSAVQRTAANAEESAASAEELSAMAGQMEDCVGELLVLVGGVAESRETVKSKGRVRTAGKVGLGRLSVAGSTAAVRNKVIPALATPAAPKKWNAAGMIPCTDENFQNF